MSASLSKKPASTRFQPTDTIEALQERLLKSIDVAFDPTAALRSDNYFLAQDYSLAGSGDSVIDPFKKNPYQALTEKARSYVEKAAAEKPLVPKRKVATNANKRNATFLTYLEVEGNLRNNRVEGPQEDYMENYTPIVSITYDNILGDVTSKNDKEDDLEELRRMIKKTKKNINAYGREVISLKRDVVEINDYASKELGYEANNALVYNVENAVNTLKREGDFKPLKKNSQLGKGGKSDENAKKLTKTNSTKSILSNSEANTLKDFGAGGKSNLGKGTLRKW